FAPATAHGPRRAAGCTSAPGAASAYGAGGGLADALGRAQRAVRAAHLAHCTRRARGVRLTGCARRRFVTACGHYDAPGEFGSSGTEPNERGALPQASRSPRVADGSHVWRHRAISYRNHSVTESAGSIGEDRRRHGLLGDALHLGHGPYRDRNEIRSVRP